MLNSDGYCLGNPEKKKKGIGGVIREGSGGWIMRYAKSFPSTTNNHMELLAIIEGLKLAEIKQLTLLEIIIDSKEVIAMLK